MSTNLNITYLCFFCRCTKRIPINSDEKRTICPRCRRKMTCLGHNIRIPRKTNKSGWKKLEEYENWMYNHKTVRKPKWWHLGWNGKK